MSINDIAKAQKIVGNPHLVDAIKKKHQERRKKSSKPKLAALANEKKAKKAALEKSSERVPVYD